MATTTAPLVEQIQAAQAAPAAVPQRSILDNLVENHEARRQAEAAIADGISASKYAKGAGIDPDMATYLIALGRDFGLNAAQSLQAIDLVGGRPALRALYKAAFLIQAGYSWKVLKHDDTVSAYRFYLRGEALTDANEKPLDFAYTMEEAVRAGYVEKARGGDGKKAGNYDRIPKNMLYARMISNFHRWHAPQVMGATMPEVGELIDAAITETESRMERSTAAAALTERIAAAKAEAAQ